MGFRLTPRSMTLDDLEPLYVQIFEIRQIHSLDGTDVCSNLRYRPIIALFSCFDKKNKYN